MEVTWVDEETAEGNMFTMCPKKACNGYMEFSGDEPCSIDNTTYISVTCNTCGHDASVNLTFNKR